MSRIKAFDENEVLYNAMTTFWQNGFNKTSIQKLVKKIGVNRASLYSTYSDKEDLYQKCFLLYRKNLTNDIERIFKNTITIKEGFDGLIDYLVLDLLDKKNGCLIVNSYIELIPHHNKSFEKIIHDTSVIFISQIKSLLQTAKKNNELTNNINISDATYIIYTLIVGTSVLSKTKTSNKQLLNSLKIIKNTIFQ